MMKPSDRIVEIMKEEGIPDPNKSSLFAIVQYLDEEFAKRTLSNKTTS